MTDPHLIWARVAVIFGGCAYSGWLAWAAPHAHIGWPIAVGLAILVLVATFKSKEEDHDR